MRFDDIKLIGLDLDGTLLNDNKELTPETEQKLIELCERGIKVVPITGRPYMGLPDCIKQIKGIEYVIASNGSQIIDAKAEKSILSFSIPTNKSIEILQELGSLDCMVEAFADGFGYIEKETYDYYVDIFTGTVVGDYIFSSRKCIPSLIDLFEQNQKLADEIFVICKNSKMRDVIMKSISEIDSIQACTLADKYLEITKEGTDKGNALMALCKHLNIDIKHTIAFGDGENDLQFLEKAGIAVAMKNACDEVKAKADIITKSNNENGVLEILKQI